VFSLGFCARESLRFVAIQARQAFKAEIPTQTHFEIGLD
jgi:hypothetical protein